MRLDPASPGAPAGRFIRLADERLGLRTYRDPGPGQPRFVGFPFAGGQSLAFRALANSLPVAWGVAAIDPPGHGWAGGQPLGSIDELVELCLAQLPAETWDNLLVYGHSMGGCVAWRLAERLAGAGRPPRGVVLGATRPATVNDQYGSFLVLDDAALFELLIRLGGLPSELASQGEVFALFRDALRADFAAFEGFVPGATPLEVPVLALGASLDQVCRPEHVGEWNRFARQLSVEFLSAGHLFLTTDPAPLAERLVRFVEQVCYPELTRR